MNNFYKRAFPVIGVASLLWNGHVFTVGGSTFAIAVAGATTAAWLYLFSVAYDRAL